MDFQDRILEKTADIEEILERFLPRAEGPQKTVIEAMNYGMRAGGKRIRPMLMLETYRLFDGKGAVIEPFMAAVEMIHNYSLIHDDLPAFDDDEYRRGRKTAHAVYGEAMGILAGDALLNYAYETALLALEREASPRVARALRILALKSGIYGMVGGQAVDIESEDRQAPLETVEFIHRLKCGALIEASMAIGAVLAGASKEEEEAALKIGALVGLAFQIQDDILDVTSSSEKLGKPAGSDEKNRKSTYVSIRGLEAARQEVGKLSGLALSALKSLSRESGFLEELIMALIVREK